MALIRQESYLEENSPSSNGAQYFIIPPPGLFGIRAGDLVLSLKDMPRSPRSLKLSRDLAMRKEQETREACIAKTDLMDQQLRSRKIDEARRFFQDKMQAELIFGSQRLRGQTTVGTTGTGAPKKVPASPIANDSRAFLLGAQAAKNSSAHKSPRERVVEERIDAVRERFVRGELIAGLVSPNMPQKSRTTPLLAASRRQVTVTNGSPETSERGSLPGGPEVAIAEDSASNRMMEGKRIACKTYLAFFYAHQFVMKLRKYVEFEGTADAFRTTPYLMTLIISVQRRTKKRVRRIILFKFLVARVLIIATVSRFAKNIRFRKRSLDAARIRMFLRDCLLQCSRVVKMRAFRRRIVKCQRAARSFLACSRCRIRIIFMKLQRVIAAGQEKELEALRIHGRHVVYQFLAKLRKKFTKERKEYLRRQRNKDDTPLFSEVDLWHVKNFLLNEADDTSQPPPQYSNQPPACGPIFKLLSRAYIKNDLLELLKFDQSGHQSGGNAHRVVARERLRKVKIRIVDTKSPILRPAKIEMAEEPTTDTFLQTNTEMMALMSVIASRIRASKHLVNKH